jgi:hypothetical protein
MLWANIGPCGIESRYFQGLEYWNLPCDSWLISRNHALLIKQGVNQSYPPGSHTRSE